MTLIKTTKIKQTIEFLSAIRAKLDILKNGHKGYKSNNVHFSWMCKYFKVTLDFFPYCLIALCKLILVVLCVLYKAGCG